MSSAISTNLIPVNIEDEMKNSYIDYAMSVIIGRALPDVRDGLKPVHRRVLFAMDELHLVYNKPYKKSARVVGEVLGKYHPHGDSAVYDTMIRMVQDFSLRYPLIDGQGNFGSVDGDSAAAMRYTEVRMSKIAQEMLRDIDKETVDFIPNFDETLAEPVVLPARIPNLLVNGSSGIAVGMATNIPPHNLGEVVDAAVHLVNNPDSTIEELANFVPGPDFPTGAYICGKNGIRDAYRTGRGKLILRGKSFIEELKNGRQNIIITELPYQVNKAKLIEAIAHLVKDKKVEGISDLRDESDRDGMRIFIGLKRDAIAKVVLNNLYKHTQLQQTFGIIMLSMVNGEPKVLNLKETLSYFVEFRKEIIVKRTRYDLRKAEEKAHILEGLKTAVENIDEVVALIKKAKNPADAKEQLMKRFPLSEIQAKEILIMQLQRLTGLERDKIISDYKETLKLIAEYKAILSNEQKVRDIVSKELLEVKEEYDDERRTEIIADPTDFDREDLIKKEDMAVTISHTGYIKRNALSVYQSQRRGGKGKTGMTTRTEDFVEHLFIASTHDFILFFSNFGKVYWIKVYEIPELGRSAKGRAIVNLLNLSAGENICASVPVSEFDSEHYVTMVTSKGIIKKTTLDAFSHPRAGGIIAVNLDEGDELVSVKITDGAKDILIAMRNGKSIRFPESDVRTTGRATRGVKGVSLTNDDRVIGMAIVDNSNSILSVTEKGFGKRTAVKEYRVQSRGGKGIITIKTTERNGKVVGVKQVSDLDNIMIIASDGKIIRLNVGELSIIGRNTQGVKLIGIDEAAKVVEVATIAHE